MTTQIMKRVFFLLAFLCLQGCEINPDSKFNVGDYVTTDLDQQVGRVNEVFCYLIVSTEKQARSPCDYNVTFPLKNGGYDSFLIEEADLKSATAFSKAISEG
jgi:hypothetical protein